MRENMTFLTNYYQIREMTIDRMKEIIDQNKRSKEGGTVFFGDSITQFMDIEKYFPEIKNKYNTNNVKYLFDKVHEKYSIPNKEKRTYHHYFYEVDKDINGEYFSLNALLQKEKVKENNGDIIKFIEEFYNNK